MTPATPEHIAHALWQQRNKFRRLHASEFQSEMALLHSVKYDLERKFYTTLESAVDFYTDLNRTVETVK